MALPSYFFFLNCSAAETSNYRKRLSGKKMARVNIVLSCDTQNLCGYNYGVSLGNVTLRFHLMFSFDVNYYLVWHKSIKNLRNFANTIANIQGDA